MTIFSKIVCLSSCLVAASLPLSAQTIQDALKFSSDMPVGTARGQALGGAVGALGGEVGAIYINPATVGFFRSSDLSFSIEYQHVNNANYYLGNKDIAKKGGLKFDNFTIVMRNKEKEHPLVFAMGVNRLNNFKEDVFYQGNIANSSQSLNYYIQADGARITDPDRQLYVGPDQDVTLNHGAALAYQTFLINPYREGDYYKFSSAAEADDYSVLVNQSHRVRTHGGTTELGLIFGKQRSEKLSLGGSLNVDFIKQGQQSIWTETNINPVHADLNYFEVTKTTTTNGIGVNLKFGALYKPVAPLNLGLTLQSPTWYGMNVDYQTEMLTDTKSSGVHTATTLVMIDDTTQAKPDNITYSIRAPWKATGSAVLLINAGHPEQATGFISADYELDDYSAMKLKYGSALDNRYNTQQVKDSYKTAANIRIGGEIKYLLYALRLGFAHYGNPYRNSDIDGARTYYSGGLGYRANGYYLDMSLITGGNQKRREVPYQMLPNSYGYVNPPAAQVTSFTTRISLTAGLKF